MLCRGERGILPAKVVEVYPEDVVQPRHVLQVAVDSTPIDAHPLAVAQYLLGVCCVPLRGYPAALPPRLENPLVHCTKQDVG